jgi:hypothetical protein
MSGLFEQGVGFGVSRLAAALRRLLDGLWAIAVEHGNELRAAWLVELRRMARVRVLAVVLAFAACGTAALVAFSLMVTFWDTHRVLVAWLTTAGFALLAVTAALLLARCMRGSQP